MGALGSRHVVRVIAGTALISGAMTGCLLTSSFDGIVGTKVTPLQDAASDLSVLPTDDASDSGNPPPDTGSDTSPPPNTFCGKVTHAFCADFDQSPNPLFGWDLLSNANNDGTVVLDTTNFVSAPAAALVTAPTGCTALDKGSIGNSKVKTIHFEVDIQAKAFGSATTTLTALLLGPTYTLYLLLTKDGSIFYNEDQSFPDGGLTYQSYGAGQLVLGQWAHVKLDVALGNPSSMATLLIDGVMKLGKTTGTLVSEASLELQVGSCIYQNNGGSILFDNVMLDLGY